MPPRECAQSLGGQQADSRTFPLASSFSNRWQDSMSWGWGHWADHSSCWPTVEPLRLTRTDSTLPKGRCCSHLPPWPCSRPSSNVGLQEGPRWPACLQRSVHDADGDRALPPPPHLHQHTTVRKEKAKEDELHTLLHPAGAPVPRSPFSLLAGDTASSPIGSFAAQARAGWQHYLQRELSMYLGNKTRKRLI